MLTNNVVMEYTQHSTNIQHKALSARLTSNWRKVAAKNGPSLGAAGLRPFFLSKSFSPTSFAVAIALTVGGFQKIKLDSDGGIQIVIALIYWLQLHKDAVKRGAVHLRRIDGEAQKRNRLSNSLIVKL